MGYSFEDSVSLCKERVPKGVAVYRQNKLLGLVASLVKWHRICADKDPVDFAAAPCGLCHSYRPSCKGCGIRMCTDPGTRYHAVLLFFKNNPQFQKGTLLSSLGEGDRVVFEKMYVSVRDLCTQEQLEHFDSVFKSV